MMYKDVVRDFALRTRENLDAFDTLRTTQREVYVVTQLINSMLGLLVFPQQQYVNSIPRIPLSELKRCGWPIPRVTGNFDQVADLNQLIRYLRNAIAHFNIKFIGDGENTIRILRVWNMAPVRDKKRRYVRDGNRRVIEKKNWEVDLTLLQLRGIADRFIDLLVSNTVALPPK